MSGLQGYVYDWWPIRLQKHHRNCQLCLHWMHAQPCNCQLYLHWMHAQPSLGNNHLQQQILQYSHSVHLIMYWFHIFFLILNQLLDIPDWDRCMECLCFSGDTHTVESLLQKLFFHFVWQRCCIVEVTPFNVQDSSLLGHDTLSLGIFWHFKGLYCLHLWGHSSWTV